MGVSPTRLENKCMGETPMLRKSSVSCMSEAAFAAGGFVEIIDLD